MALTVAQIHSAKSDDELIKLLLAELRQHFPPQIRADAVVFLSRLQNSPLGLRAMAATYDLDVSMALDDLAWHFINHHSLPEFAEETIFALRELEAPEAADLFAAAFEIIKPHWQELQSDRESKAAHDWLNATGIQAAINPLNTRMWDYLKQFPAQGLFSLWATYARKYPERCIAAN